ncbi:hypothetical protein O0L34_g152 [Tuta absoluta]|nr:hypothetical protein O0L34_g152 [Tuta absoluta]
MEHFIESVRKYPCLWNTTAIEYRDQELKDAAWTEVMKETDLSSVKEVKLKWKKLRDSYRDALKRQGEMLAREPHAAGKKPYPWKYMGPMQFLQPHMNARKRPDPPTSAAAKPGRERDEPLLNGNHHAARSSSSSDSDASPARSEAAAASPPPPPAKRRALDHIDRKLAYLCKRRRSSPPPHAAAAAAQPDPLDIFFNSMCQATKRLPFVTQIKIKRALFEVVTAGEEALLEQQASYAGMWQTAPGAGAGAGAGAGDGSSSSSEGGAPDEDDHRAAV